MRLKAEYLNMGIWLPQINQIVEGRFIPSDLVPYLSKKYPEFFEEEVQDTKITKKSKDALPITDPIQYEIGDDNKAK